MPVTAHSLTDGGEALLIRPDETERRLYRVLRADREGGVAEVCALSVERMRRFDPAPDGRLILGMTDDDVYLFDEGRKTRFLDDRQFQFWDVSLAPGSGSFLCAYSDALCAAHGVAFGERSGRLSWTRDLQVAPARVSLSADGRALAVGLQDGGLLALDRERGILWEHRQEEPISALAMPLTGASVLAGTEAGSVLSLDGEGGLRWRTAFGLPVIGAAVDGRGEWSAAVFSDGKRHLLACLDPEGSPAWEHELEHRPDGLALAPGGGFLLVSTTAGAALLFETDFSAVSVSAGSTRRARALASARAAEGAGEYEQARRLLLPVVKAHPHDLEAAAYLDELTCRLIERRRGEAATRAREGRLREALEALEAAAALDPWSEALFRERAEYRRRACEECQARALAAEARADWASAFLAWQEGLTLDSAWTEARAEMGRLRRRQAEELMHKGEGRREAGDLAGAAALWRQALELASRPEWETRLRELEGERCLQAGIAHFEARRMPEALFQLRKVLVLDPGNREAARYLRYAEQPADDGTIQDRFRRLED